MIKTSNAGNASAFVARVAQQVTPTSTVTIEHAAIVEGQRVTIDRYVMSADALREIEPCECRRRDANALGGYLQSSAVAKLLGVKTATLAKWRRQDKGPLGWVKTSPTSVAYPEAEVRTFLTMLRKGGAASADQRPVHARYARAEVGQAA